MDATSLRQDELTSIVVEDFSTQKKYQVVASTGEAAAVLGSLLKASAIGGQRSSVTEVPSARQREVVT